MKLLPTTFGQFWTRVPCSPAFTVTIQILFATFQLFNVKGSTATRIATSPDFRKFATLDDAGIVYNLVDMSLSTATVLWLNVTLMKNEWVKRKYDEVLFK